MLLLVRFTITKLKILSFSRLIPESPRWQVSKGRHDQARETLERVAKSNSEHCSPQYCDVTVVNGQVDEISSSSEQSIDVTSNKTTVLKLTDVLRSPQMALRTTVVLVNR